MNENSGKATSNQRRLREAIQDFERLCPYGNELVAYLRRDHVEIYGAFRDTDRWRLWLTLPEQLRAMFDIQLDVLLIATTFEKVEPRILTDIHRALREPRVDHEVAVLVSNDRRAADLVRQRRGETAVLALDAKALGPEEPGFRQALSTALITVDHFNVTRPIRNESAFFGRDKDVDELRQCVKDAQHVGLFALQKTGKSSLLNQLQRRLEEQEWKVIATDLNECQGKPELLEQRILEGLEALSRRSSWIESVEAALDRPGQQSVAIIIDEVDVAMMGRSFAQNDDATRLVQSLAQLRALCQRRQMKDQLFPVLVCAGVDSSIFEQARLFGRTNPLYQFARLIFLELLPRDDLASMVRTLGKRTGMRFRSHTLIDELYAEYGGHPLLTRQACSYVHRHRPPGVVPYHVEDDDLARAFEARGPNTPQHHARQIPETFAQYFPEEGAALIGHLRDGEQPDVARMEHAVAYGIVDGRDGRVRIRAVERAYRHGN